MFGASQIIFRHPIFHTPLRDVVRGRLTGRLAWRRMLEASTLTSETKECIAETVARTRLWPLEQVAVAEELIAHFTDANAIDSAASEPASNASGAAAFGDRRLAAKLIRRAKIRQRPIAWHALRWTGRGVAALLVLYGLLSARFYLSKPQIKTNYLALLNAPLMNMPESDRAWPMYRQVVLAIGVEKGGLKLPGGWDFDLLELRPLDERWPQLVRWVTGHAPQIDLLRQAAAKPDLGFVLGAGPQGSEDDPELGWSNARTPSNDEATSLISVGLRYLNFEQAFGRILQADARVAIEFDDAERVERDLNALIDLCRQKDRSFVIGRSVSLAVFRNGLGVLGDLLRDKPQLLSDAALIRLAHRFSAINSTIAEIDLTTERMFMADFVQRAYSDGGYGGGALTFKGFEQLQGLVDRRDPEAERAYDLLGYSSGIFAANRDDTMAEYDRLMAAQESELRKNIREADLGLIARERKRLRTSTLGAARFLPVALLVPDLARYRQQVERTLGYEDGTLIAIGLELYRRRHGQYPKQLEALVPDLLPALPIDRVSGGALHYKLVDDIPLLYSIGADQIDDGGTRVTSKAVLDGKVISDYADRWDIKPADAPRGDWILYPPIARGVAF